MGGLLAALLILLAGALAALHAQSSPSISIELSPGNSVPQNTAITGTVTLSNLDPSDYSSLIFRADTTKYDPSKYPEAASCLGDDVNEDITIAVDESREVFTISVYKACALDIYAHYTLDLTISKADVELASAEHAFSMTRYLTGAGPTATPPAPDAQAWIDPDPRTLNMRVHGEWQEFHFRSDVTKYLNDHLGVMMFGNEYGYFAAPGESRPSMTPEVACQRSADDNINWRRAINQGLWAVACKPGQVFMRLIHESDGVDPLYEYEFTTRDDSEPPPPTPQPPPPPPPPITRGGGGGGGGGGAPQNRSPEFTDGATTDLSIAENTPAGEDIGDPVAAKDREDDTLTYSLRGADAESFDIDRATGQLRTKAPLDYEAQAAYSVIVSVSDGKSSSGRDSDARDDSITVTIDIENVDEPGEVALSSHQPQVAVALTATLTDLDGGLSGITWLWERSADQTDWTEIDGARTASYTPAIGDLSSYLRVTVSYEDGHGRGKSAGAVTGDPVLVNTVPRFPGAAIEIEVEEGSGDAESGGVGEPVAAADPDGDTLISSLGGDDAEFFEIDVSTGQLWSKAPLDYETQAVYTVVVSVRDGKGLQRGPRHGHRRLRHGDHRRRQRGRTGDARFAVVRAAGRRPPRRPPDRPGRGRGRGGLEVGAFA